MNAAVTFPEIAFGPAIEDFALADLYLSPLNPRQDADCEGIDLLAQSLVACGLVQNLAGIKDAEGRVAIVAGGRRLRALQIAVLERADLATVPVMIAPDEATALAWASAENVARENMDAADEIRAYRKMAETGAAVAEIARVFAVTENHVYRRLKLSSLPALVLDALKRRDLSLDQAAAFTVSESEERIAALLPDVLRFRRSAYDIRRLLKEDATHGGNRKAVFVGPEDYKAAGGTIVTDLFESNTYYEDAALLQTLFSEKLAKAAENAKAEGWAWVEISEEQFEYWNCDYTKVTGQPVALTDEQQARLEELEGLDQEEGLDDEGYDELEALQLLLERVEVTAEQRSVSGIVLDVDHSGNLRVCGPYVRAEEAEKALEIGAVASLDRRTLTASNPPAKPVFSQAVTDDLRSVRLHAFQHSLRNDPKLALKLLAFSLFNKTGTDNIFGLRVEMPKNVPSAESGLTVDPSLVQPERQYDRGGIDERFADFCQQSDDEIMGALIAGAVRTMHTNFGYHTTNGAEFFGTLNKALNVNPRDVWTPTKDGFWQRMPGHYLDKTFFELTGNTTETTDGKFFLKLKKGEKADHMEKLFTDAAYQSTLGLTDEQIAVIADWMPTSE